MPGPTTIDRLDAEGLTPQQAGDLRRLLSSSDLAGPGGQHDAWAKALGILFEHGRPPFSTFESAARTIFAGRDPQRDGPAPIWHPTQEERAQANVTRLMRVAQHNDYGSFHRWSADNRDAFWRLLLRQIDFPFHREPTAIRDAASPVERPAWLPGAEFNVAQACLRADPARVAIVYGTEFEPTMRRLTYGELASLVDRVANGLDRMGLARGDRVALYLPMTPESVAAYLGIIKSGRVAVGIADASAAPDVEKRIRISGAKAIITMDAYVRDGKRLLVYAKAKEANAPTAIVVAAEGKGEATALRAGDMRWEAFLGEQRPRPFVHVGPDAPTNILFSSGTTKDPKAIVWTQTTPLKCIMDAHVHHDVKADDVLAWPTSFGWMMGPWLTYAALSHGATMALWGGSPLASGFGRFIQDARVTMLGVVPKLVRAWKTSRHMETSDWSRIRRFSSTGETSDPEEMLYLMWLAHNKPVIEYCGGTEIGGGYVTGTMVQAASPSAFSTPACGLDLHLLDAQGRLTSRGEVGIVPPSIGLSNEILNYDHRKEYFEGFFRGPRGEVLRRHGDQLERLGSGYIRHHGRMDDMINLNGVKTSVEELRATIGHHPDVYDTKPIAVDVEGKGQRVLVVYAVPKDASRMDEAGLKAALRADFSKKIKEGLNPLLSHVHDVVLVPELPQAGPGKTRTMKEFLKDYESRRAPTASRGA